MKNHGIKVLVGKIAKKTRYMVVMDTLIRQTEKMEIDPNVHALVGNIVTGIWLEKVACCAKDTIYSDERSERANANLAMKIPQLHSRPST